MKKEVKHLLYLSIALILLYFLSYAFNLGWLRFSELKFQDFLYNMRGKMKIDPHVIVVGIDEKSLSWFEGEGDFWPLSRAKYALVIHKLFQAGAKAVLLDISFTNPSEEDPKGDRYLAAILLLDKKVVLGTYLINKKKTYDYYSGNVKKELEKNIGYLRYVYKMKNFQDLSLITPISIYKVRPPIKIFTDVAPAASFEVAAVDIDGKIRRLPLFIEEKWAIETKRTSGFLPHMDILGYALYLGQNPMKTDLIVDFKKRRIEIPMKKNGIKVKTFYVPFDNNGLLNLYYYGKGIDNFKTVSFLDVYKCSPTELKKLVNGKLVIIGYTATAKGLYDLRVTPFSNNEPGVYIHATAIENMIRGDNLKHIPFIYELVIVVLIIFVALIILTLNKIEINFLVFLIIPALLAVSYFYFNNKVFLDTSFPILSVFIMGLFGISEKFYIDAKDKRRFREFLYRYLDEKIADQIIKEGKTQLSNEKKNVVVLFSDIRGFTKMSENKNPEEIVKILNIYFDRMSNVIRNNGGMIDKFIGDAIMAVFGVPFSQEDDVERAVKSAIEMRKELKKLREEMGIDIDNGIGLHYGEVVVGNIGASFRWDYTCIGDTVNTASRVESLTRRINKPILITGAVYEKIQNKFRVNYEGAYEVKGKSDKIRVFSVYEDQ